MPSDNDPNNDPLIFWVTGGPFNSTFSYAFVENGPFMFDDQDIVQKNKHSYNLVANLLFVDNPVGSGFSQSSETDVYKTFQNDKGLMDNISDLFKFLIQLQKINPHLKKNKLQIQGQGKDSQKACIFASLISKINISQHEPDSEQYDYANQIFDNYPQKINLAGVGLYSAWLIPTQHQASMKIYTQNANEFVIGNKVENTMKFTIEQCLRALGKCASNQNQCTFTKSICNLYTYLPFLTNKINPLDVRKPCKKLPHCYSFDHIEDIMKHPQTKKLINIPFQVNYQSSFSNKLLSRLQNMLFVLPLGPTVQEMVPNSLKLLLDNDIKVMVVQGDKDQLFNHIGGLNAIKSIRWKQQINFNKVKESQYLHDSNGEQQAIGKQKTFKNLTYIRIKDAGHQFGLDQPKFSFQIFKDFIDKK